MTRKVLMLLMTLGMVALMLAACSGEAEETLEAIAPTIEAKVEEIAPTIEAAVEEIAPTVKAAVEEVTAAEEPAPAEEMEACAPIEDGPLAGVDPRGQSIIWWHQHSGSREEKLLPLVEQFNETNECGITVEAQNQGGYNDIRDKVNVSSAAGEQPAALVVGYQNDQAFYQLNETLVDLDPYLDDAYWGLTAEDKDDFFESFITQGIHPAFDNQRLGFPPNRSMEVLYYNQTWLEELGFDGPPTTPEEFKEMACAGAEDNGDGTGGYILRDDASAVAAWTLAFGGDILNEEGTGYKYDGDATVQAMTMLKEMLDEGCAFFYTEGYPNPAFAARQGIFTQGSSSGLPYYSGDVATIAEEEGREEDVWGVTAIPHTTADPVQNIYGADIMITNTTPEKQLAAWEFIKWFTSPEIQAEWNQISGYFPTRRGTVEFLGDYKDENPQWSTALDLLPYGSYEPQLISYQSTRDAAQAAFNEIMQLVEGWTAEDIIAILTALTEEANELQAELMAEIE